MTSRSITFGRFLPLTAILVAATGGVQAGEVAVLKNGQSLAVAGYRLDGDRLLLRIAGGGELALPASQVLEIRRTPEEAPVPFAAPSTAPPAVEATAAMADRKSVV